MRPIVLALVIALGAVTCTDDREPSAPVQPPTTFEGQPESLTTVPDSGSNDAVLTTTLRPADPTGITAADLCAGAMLVEPTPQIDTDLLPETSGVVYSRTVDGRMYAHNDSGNLPRLFGIGTGSTVDDVWTVGTALLDWEDIAVAGSTLYFADTGDNLHIRPTVRLIASPEPDGNGATLDNLEFWSFTFAEGRLDTEALMVDVDGTEAVLITKGIDSPAGIYVLRLGEGWSGQGGERQDGGSEKVFHGDRPPEHVIRNSSFQLDRHSNETPQRLPVHDDVEWSAAESRSARMRAAFRSARMRTSSMVAK
ncbi:MAG: hypothetical protein EBY65_11125 [Acidimicrobiia bacterium]|nr:hypothetical protein [Acidimicrobiia bacterium]